MLSDYDSIHDLAPVAILFTPTTLKFSSTAFLQLESNTRRRSPACLNGSL
jgi:hypothetical protein